MIAPEREFTLRAVIIALLVAVVIGLSYPYVVLKLGFGPNIAVVSAFFGWIALSTITRGKSLKRESNLAQAAGMIAGQTAFLCVVLAAFDLLMLDGTTGFDLKLTKLQIFSWLTTAGILGVLLAVPLRRHFIVDEKLPFPDGFAAGETLLVLDERGAGSRRAARAMFGGLFASGLLAFLVMRKKFLVFQEDFLALPFNRFSGVTGTGFSYSLLNLGSGMIIGLRICTNMAVGSALAWIIAPVLLNDHGQIADTATKRDILLWIMWPATGLMVAGGLTALFLKWRILTRTFRQLSGASVESGDFPMRWVVIGSIVSGIALIVVQRFQLGLPIWQTLVAIALTLPLMLVGLRVLGETNWGPISALSNLMQGVFAALAPGNVQANMVASGVTGSIVAESEGLMQSYKTGEMVGSTPRYLTYIQLMAVPIGAAAVAYAYPLLRATYGIGGEKGLPCPTSQKWVGLAKMVNEGIGALPKSAVVALAIAVVLGILFAVLEQNAKWRTWVPSATSIGIGMLIPSNAVATMMIGALIAWAANRKDPEGSNRWVLPLASGFIAGDALVAIIVAALIAQGVLVAL
ncbi:MAG: OPT family oligopeptide transporter [Planctomycetota bacterium]